MDESIRNIIATKSNEARDVENIGPHRASELSVELASLEANLNKYIVERDFAYRQKKLEFRKQMKSTAEANTHAEATDEYREWQEALMQGKALKSLIGSLRLYVRNAHEEYRNQ